MSILFARLPNHVGDACMCLPALDVLAASGRDLVLLGRPWASALFAAHGWSSVELPPRFISGQRVLSELARRHTPRPPGVLFTNTVSTALQFTLAGIPAAGYAWPARRWLLRRAVPVPPAWSGPMHTVAFYHALACAVAANPMTLPQRLGLKVSDSARTRAASLLTAAGVSATYAVLCPLATGLHHGRVKAWAGFERLSLRLQRCGLPVVVCPGPGEGDAVRRAVPSAIVLPETDLGTFAALLAASRLVVANDSGPGHVAAAVDAPLVSIFGVTEPTKTRPWGPTARLVGSERGWPDDQQVFEAVDAALVAP
jgi:heptosyltransferase-2